MTPPRAVTPRTPPAQQVAAAVASARSEALAATSPRYKNPPRRPPPKVSARATIGTPGNASGGGGAGRYNGYNATAYCHEAQWRRNDADHRGPQYTGGGTNPRFISVGAAKGSPRDEQGDRSDAGRPNVRTCQQALRSNLIMRQLNESASWLSDVGNDSEPSDDEAGARNGPGRRGSRGDSSANQPQLADGRSLFMMGNLNVSATWIDTDIDWESDQDEPTPPVGVPYVAVTGPQPVHVPLRSQSLPC